MRKTILCTLVLFIVVLLAGCGGGKTVAPAETVIADDSTADSSTLDDSAKDISTMDDSVMIGEPVEASSARAGREKVEGCTDTDGGLNYEVKGTVSTNSIMEEDICSGNTKAYAGRLYEEYCTEEGKHVRMTYDCPSGLCADGACVE